MPEEENIELVDRIEVDGKIIKLFHRDHLVKEGEMVVWMDGVSLYQEEGKLKIQVDEPMECVIEGPYVTCDLHPSPLREV